MAYLFWGVVNVQGLGLVSQLCSSMIATKVGEVDLDNGNRCSSLLLHWGVANEKCTNYLGKYTCGSTWYW